MVVGRLQHRAGGVPREGLLELIRVQTVREGGRRLLLHGMQNLVLAFAEVMGVAEDGGEEARH
jgi:hypothetical protein